MIGGLGGREEREEISRRAICLLAAAHSCAGVGPANAGDGRGEHYAGFVQRRRAFLDPEAAMAHALDCWTKERIAGPGRGEHAAGFARGLTHGPAVSAEEEQARLLPVLEGILKARPDACFPWTLTRRRRRGLLSRRARRL